MLRFSSGMIPLGSLSLDERQVKLICVGFLKKKKKKDFFVWLYGVAAQGKTHGGVFKVVEAVVSQNEPASLPGFHSPTSKKERERERESR